MAQAIPEGTHNVTPHLVVNGGARAIDFYAAAFGAIEHYRMPGPGGSVAHAEIQIGDSVVYLADEFPGGSPSPRSLRGSPVVLHLYVEDADAAFARAVRAGARVKMPLMDMFWGDRYGQVTDPFGHTWSIATHTEDVSPEEMARRAETAMSSMAAPPKPKPRRKAARKAARKPARKPSRRPSKAKAARKGKRR
jgi:PhnB protein